MTQDINPLEMAPASQPHVLPEANLDTAREVFPIMLEKDILDFRPVDRPDEVDEILLPKGSVAPASVTSLNSMTGLEDVSPEDLVPSVLSSAVKDTPKKSESTSPTSVPSTRVGKTKPTVVT